MVDNSVQLSIVVISWNTQDLLTHCLESVGEEKHILSNGFLELIVVDNASKDGSPAMVRDQFPWATLICNEDNLGFAKANNQGIYQSHGRYVLLLNSDTEVHPGALRKLVQFLDNNPKAGAVGAKLVNSDGSLQPACHPMLTPGREFWRLMFLDRLWPKASYSLDRWDDSQPRRVEVIKGACLLLRREALDEIGVLDERYFFYTEEMDLCYRLAQADWGIWYLPTAVVTHHGGASSSQMKEEMYLQLYRSKVQFHRKVGGRKQSLYFKSLLMFAYLPRAILRPANHSYRRMLVETPRM